MSNQSIESTLRSEPCRRVSGSSSERIMVYVDDLSFDASHDLSLDLCRRLSNCYTLYPLEGRPSLYLPDPDTIEPQLNDHSVLYLARSDDKLRPNVSIHTKTSSLRPTRSNSELDQRSSRRSSVQSSRSRMNSCSKPTPLGTKSTDNGRRSSTSRPTKQRRANSARRKDSVRPVKAEVREAGKVVGNVEDLEEARRHRRLTMIILGMFIFLLVTSILAVVVTLTHSSFLSPAIGSKELAEHRFPLRRENEELFNSLNRDYTAENTTGPP